MNYLNIKIRCSLFFRLLICLAIFPFLLSFVNPLRGYPQTEPGVHLLPAPGSMITLSQRVVPSILKGVRIYKEKPLRLDFILDQGDPAIPKEELWQESQKLIKYFLASLTIPEDDLWVNLSPYEKNRIIPKEFGITEMGRDLLSQDYVLKQLIASLTYPESGLGKEFWDRVYQRAYEMYGTTDIPLDTFNKVWVIPDKAVVYEKDDTAFVVDSHLKVMMEEDYLAIQKNDDHLDLESGQVESFSGINHISLQIAKEILLPEIEQEVNQGKNFALLRQVYHSLILATWYKKALKESVLNKAYSDRRKVTGVDVEDKQIKQKIYDQYLGALKMGVYDFIKEDYDPFMHQVIPRKYFSGGFNLIIEPEIKKDFALLTAKEEQNLVETNNPQMVSVQLEVEKENKTKFSKQESMQQMEDIIDQFKAAYESAEEEIIINNVMPLISARGITSRKTPTPNGGAWGRQDSLKFGGANFVKIEAIIRKKGKEISITFRAYKENKKGEHEFFKETVWWWDWEKERFKYDQDRLISQIKDIYKFEGNIKKTKDVTSLASEMGVVISKWPTPDGGTWRKDNLRIGTKLSKIEADFVKQGEEIKVIVRGYKKDGDKLVLTKTSTWIWNKEKKKYEHHQDRLIQEIKAVYQMVKVEEDLDVRFEETGENLDVRPETIRKEMDVTELVHKDTGTVSVLYPLPNDEKWDKTSYLKIGRDLSKVKVFTEIEGMRISKTFVGYKKDEKGEHKKYDECIWDWNWTKGKYEARKDEADNAIEDIKNIYRNEEDIEKIIDITTLVDLSRGVISAKVPLPNGRTWGTQDSLKLGRGLSGVMAIFRKQKGEISITFQGYKKDGKGNESLDKETDWEWNDKEGKFEETDEKRKRIARDQLKDAYQSEDIVIEVDITALVTLSSGMANKGLILPNGKDLDAQVYLQIGENLSGAKVIIYKKEGKVSTLEFVGYKDGQEIKRQYWQWNEQTAQISPLSSEEVMHQFIDQYDLQQLVATGVDDPDLLYGYLLLTSELSPDLAQQVVMQSFRGIRGYSSGYNKVKDYTNYKESPGEIALSEYPQHTEEVHIEIKGKVSGDYSLVQIEGDRNKIVPVDKKGAFSARFILPRGTETNLIFFGFNDEDQTRSPPVEITIHQISPPKNIEEIFDDLLKQKEEIRKKISQRAEQLHYLTKRKEIGLLKFFTENEKEGFKVLDEKIRTTKSDLMKKIYSSIRTKFQEISNLQIMDFRSDKERLYFYQKYVLYEIQRRMQERETSKRGIILALEQGLGKTIVVLSAIRGHEQGAMIIVPNAVVTSWGEQEGKFFERQLLEIIDGRDAKEKTEQIREAGNVPKVTNIEYLRSNTHNRFDAMNHNSEQIVVFDESQFISRSGTHQSRGAQALQGTFTILMSATPFSKVQAARPVFEFLEKGKKGFQDTDIFGQLFKQSDPDSLRLLHFMLNPYVIRIKKRHVFKEFDRSLPLDKQHDRLPAKNFIPPEQLGLFTITESQEESIFQLFTDWDTWRENQNRHTERTVDDLILQRNQGDPSFFSRLHSLRQIVNNPKYIGREEEESPKHKKMDEIIEEEVVRRDGKVLIFVQYKEQVREYQKRYAQHSVVTYYGDTEKEMPTKGKYLADEKGNVLKFRKVNKYEYAFDKDGHLIEDERGDPITPLDYNRLRFQHGQDDKIIIATYRTGGVGVTFSAADAVIRDDAARDFSERYQGDDRANRIDNIRKKYEQRYYSLISQYSPQFLERMKALSRVFNKEIGESKIIESSKVTAAMRLNEDLKIESVYEVYFAQGTYDQVHDVNLNIQKTIFDLVLDGLPGEEEIDVSNNQYLKDAMPFLFEGEAADVLDPVGGEELEDAAMMSDVGGIDFNPSNFNLEVDKEGKSINFGESQGNLNELEKGNFQGLFPVIIDINPVDIPLILGISEEDDIQENMQTSHNWKEKMVSCLFMA